jgi:hypothetical protein
MDASPHFRRSRQLCEQSEFADSIWRAGSRRATEIRTKQLRSKCSFVRLGDPTRTIFS